MRNVIRFAALVAVFLVLGTTILLAPSVTMSAPTDVEPIIHAQPQVVLGLWDCETVNCQPRRESGVGRSMRFFPGEAVVGFQIMLDGDGQDWNHQGWRHGGNDNRNDNDRDHRGGAVLTRCFLPYANQGGWVLDGAINPWPQEAYRYPNC